MTLTLAASSAQGALLSCDGCHCRKFVGLLRTPYQNSSFTPNCRIRGSKADVIRPNWGDDTLLFGALKFTLLKILKSSARSCRPILSVRFVTLSSATSVLK